MKVILFAILFCMIASTNARSFSTYSRLNPEETQVSTLTADPETVFDFYLGLIFGWQTQQTIPGQCHADNLAFFNSLGDTWLTFLRAYRPDTWFNFLDRIRINIDTMSKALQSCQIHSILTKLERIVTFDGLVETGARLITQITFLQGYMNQFSTHIAAGEMRLAGVQIGLLMSAIIGVTVN